MKTSTQFSKEANKINMTAHERETLRERLVSYMEYHPLHMPVTPQRNRFFAYVTNCFLSLGNVRILRLRTRVVVLAFLFLMTLPFVAEHALPGDALYPIKVRFNEGIRSKLLFSPYEKMQWETARVERRIAEARLLVKEGKLTEETATALEETVRSHTTAFQAQLATLRKSDTTGATIAEVTFESALDVQSAVLNTEIAQEASSTTPNEGDVNGIAAIVREARADVVSSTDQQSGIGAYEALSARVEENTTRIHALSQSLANELTDVQKADIQERTGDVDAAIVAGKEAHEGAKMDAAAIEPLRHALATTEKLIAFMSSIDLRSNVSLDLLVPQDISQNTPKTELETNVASSTEKIGVVTP